MEFIIHENEWYWGTSYIIVTSDGKGIIKATVDNSGQATISNVSVHKSARGNGYMRMLMDEAEKIIKEHNILQIKLICNKKHFVYDFYQKRGYTYYGDYFNDENYDMITMIKNI